MSALEDRLRALGLALPLMTAPVRLALLVAAVAGSYAVGRAAPQHSREAAAVRSARAQQNTAIAARDFDRAASFWTEDVVIRSGLGLIIQGRANYRSAFVADGSYHRHWCIYSGGTVEPATEESVKAGRTRVKMFDRYPPEINHEGWPRLVRKLACEGGFGVSDIDFIVLTQVRKPSIELVMNDLGLPLDRTHMIMEDWGYTGSACIPMALDDAVEKRKLKAGDLVVFVGSGVGYNQAAVALRW
jgi:hypothetical protein